MLSERDCTKCSARQKIEWGCEAKPKQPLLLDGKEMDRCPRRPLLEEPYKYGQIFWLYRQAQNGYLPEAGGLENQPSLLLDCFRVIDRALDFCREEQEARDKRRKARQDRAKALADPRNR